MLIQEIERFLKARRMPPARFGREAMGDPSFVFRLKAGRHSRASTEERVRAYLARQSEDPSC